MAIPWLIGAAVVAVGTAVVAAVTDDETTSSSSSDLEREKRRAEEKRQNDIREHEEKTKLLKIKSQCNKVINDFDLKLTAEDLLVAHDNGSLKEVVMESYKKTQEHKDYYESIKYLNDFIETLYQVEVDLMKG